MQLDVTLPDALRVGVTEPREERENPVEKEETPIGLASLKGFPLSGEDRVDIYPCVLFFSGRIAQWTEHEASNLNAGSSSLPTPIW